MNRLAKFWSLTTCEKQLLCEASACLLVSNVLVRTIAFRQINKYLRTLWNNTCSRGYVHQDEIELIRFSISRAANVVPGRNLCLSRSIAEFIMLRRRSIPAVLLVGARFAGNSSLEAHAWVEPDANASDFGTDNSNFTILIRIGGPAVRQ
jgi:hypothetical protein